MLRMISTIESNSINKRDYQDRFSGLLQANFSTIAGEPWKSATLRLMSREEEILINWESKKLSFWQRVQH